MHTSQVDDDASERAPIDERGNREKQERGYMIDSTYTVTATRNCNARNELEDEDEDENAQIVLP
jgi:hypothetical protein